MNNSEIEAAEIWYYKRTQGEKVKDDLRSGSDLSDEILDKIVDKFAEMHCKRLMSGYNELYSTFLADNTKTVKDTKIARKVYRGRVLLFDGGNLKVLTEKNPYIK